VVFLTAAGALGLNGAAAVVTTVGTVVTKILLAISAGAVFMGAMTYIGNAPNFMVKSIAERSGIKMPSFFGYMGWSCAILVPLFILDSLLFFL
ncbi:MAG: sodium:proton antiporter, partial [Pseudomonas sp.]